MPAPLNLARDDVDRSNSELALGEGPTWQRKANWPEWVASADASASFERSLPAPRRHRAGSQRGPLFDPQRPFAVAVLAGRFCPIAAVAGSQLGPPGTGPRHSLCGKFSGFGRALYRRRVSVGDELLDGSNVVRAMGWLRRIEG